jgi:hypothetical protein
MVLFFFHFTKLIIDFYYNSSETLGGGVIPVSVSPIVIVIMFHIVPTPESF